MYQRLLNANYSCFMGASPIDVDWLESLKSHTQVAKQIKYVKVTLWMDPSTNSSALYYSSLLLAQVEGDLCVFLWGSCITLMLSV